MGKISLFFPVAIIDLSRDEIFSFNTISLVTDHFEMMSGGKKVTHSKSVSFNLIFSNVTRSLKININNIIFLFSIQLNDYLDFIFVQFFIVKKEKKRYANYCTMKCDILTWR